MRFLITGATGFIGTALTDHLNKYGHETGLLLRDTSSDPRVAEDTGTEVFRTQGTYADLLDILAGWAPDIVIHLASLFISSHEPDDVTPLVTSNIIFPAQLIEAMNTCGVKQLVNTGTSWQHYRNTGGYNPVNLYAATKQAAEAIFDFHCQSHEFKIITLKLFDTYGPGDLRNKLIPYLLNHLGQEEPVPLSLGEQKLDLVHIDDVCRAYGVAVELIKAMAPGVHDSYGISSGTHVSIRDLVKKIEHISGQRLPVTWGGRPYRHREVFEPWTGYTPLPGWTSEIDLEEGLKGLILK